MIRAIFFDIGGVLIQLSFKKLCDAIATYSDYSSEEVFNLFIKSGLVSSYEKGEMDSSQFFLESKNMLNLRLMEKDFFEIWNFLFFKMDKVDKIVEKLSDNFKMAIISNTNPAHVEYFEKNLSCLRFFDSKIFSYEVNMLKPDEKIFKLACAKLNVEPREVIFIDDTGYNIEVAEEMGMVAIRFENPEQLIKDLKYFGIRNI